MFLPKFIHIVLILVSYDLNNNSVVSDEYDETELRHDNERNHNEILKRTPFDDTHFINARLQSKETILRTSFRDTDYINQSTDLSELSRTNTRSYRMMLQYIQHTLPEGNLKYTDKDIDDCTSSSETKIPTMSDFIEDIAQKEKTVLDKKQLIVYETICSTFLLSLVDDGRDSSTTLGRYFCDISGNNSTNSDHRVRKVTQHLKSLGGKKQLLMFLTGPAGAGKTTAVKTAERFCFEFCKAVGVVWQDNRFLFTAYTGSAASTFGGMTICKTAYLNKRKALDDLDVMAWHGVRILIIDEISFMKSTDMRRLEENLQVIGQRNKPFGGFSIIFSGDFRQLEPSKAKPQQLLFSRDASIDWEQKLNAVVILENKHRFKDDPQYGKLLKKMWMKDISRKDRIWLNTRVVTNEGFTLPKAEEFGIKDVVYATPYNKERNSITAGNFKDHIEQTHPSIDDIDDPPSHTIIIEAEMLSAAPKTSKHFGKKIRGMLRHRILTTCGDANVSAGTKHVDPALCLYVGAHVICTIGNENLNKKVSRGNGTPCRVVGIKLKEQQSSYRWKNYYGKKVWTVCATDVEWIECEHHPKPRSLTDIEIKIEQIQSRLSSGRNKNKLPLEREIAILKDSHNRQLAHQRFKLEPRLDTVQVSVHIHPIALTPDNFRCKMIQLPINANDATTGHKLQGMSKDIVIITSWPSGGLFKNWEYVVLSRVRTHNGLYLFQPISLNKSFEPSEELKLFFKRAKKLQATFLRERTRLQKRLKNQKNQ